IDYRDPVSRGRTIAFLSFFFPVLWAVLFFIMWDPVFMVLAGGAITAAILLLVVVGAVHFRYRRLPASLKPSLGYDIGFWISVVAIVFLAVLAVWKAVEEFQKVS
ncbi:MAG TPA: divalent metal cation transporter, partial [Bacteroidia bacterium]|nr:divalent metal cation transporter [Bacteroidia bacterium]